VLAKAELHVHLEGTAPPQLVCRIAARNGLEVPEGLFATPERFAWRDFLDFLNTYDMAASVIRTAEDYRQITAEYLASCAAEGAIYIEVTASPDHARLVGLSADEMVAGIAAGIDEARAAHGIEARILLVAIRNYGPEAALRIVSDAVDRPHPYVVGLSLAGDEAGYPPAPFGEPYAAAAAAGLGCTVHAGEWAGADSVRAALELPVTRISHAVRAVEDPGLVEELALRGIVLECCPTSNVALGVYPSFDDHPLPGLRAAGVRVTLGSDDPPYFGASLGGEYDVARERFGYGDADLLELTRTAIDASFAGPELRARMLARTHEDSLPRS
jgi:adenosine deaminase